MLTIFSNNERLKVTYSNIIYAFKFLTNQSNLVYALKIML